MVTCRSKALLPIAIEMLKIFYSDELGAEIRSMNYQVQARESNQEKPIHKLELLDEQLLDKVRHCREYYFIPHT